SGPDYNLTLNLSAPAPALVAAVIPVNVNFNASQHLAGLSIGAGALATMSTNGNRVLATKSLVIAGTTDAWTGKVELTNNDMIVQADAVTRQTVLDTVTNQIKTARAGGAWTGNGITSSAAAANANGITGLAVILNDNGHGTKLFSTFDGQAVDQNA